ncbi:UvrD-helicase domain-containing protein [Ancrocorticia sp.]|uniref:UvrD-helicase domain-containing protein n=1 Tax=Ancrocorticia sp. TaxID=2593684 RepID=UPI003F8E16BB
MSDELTPRERAIAHEQHHVDESYTALDRQRLSYEKRLADVRAQSGLESPGARSERDSFATHYEDNLLRIRNVENRLVMGRLDFHDGSLEHIGRIGLRDEAQEIILLDWRAPQAEPFYQATAAHPGNVVRRRHIQTRLREVTGIEDELLRSDSASDSDLELTGEGALMSAMSQARDGKMTDIVATIQAEQDRVIRADSRGVLVVQGGPGTGKTAVALHRAAYLLYAQRERLSRSGVLVIGPSPVFLRYIDQVLPSLGETDVVATTIGGLMPGITATADESAAAKRVKSGLAWRDIAQRAVSQLLERPLAQPVSFQIDAEKVTLRPKDVEAAQRKARRTEQLHNEARDTYARALVDVLAGQVAAAKELELADNQWIISDVAASRDARREINLHWLPSSPVQLLERLLAHPERLAEVAPEFSEAERRAIYRPQGSGLTEADVAIIDEFAEYLGFFSTDFERNQREAAQARNSELSAYVAQTMDAMNLGEGIVDAQMLTERVSTTDSHATLAERATMDRTWTYGHVVVDEAQELSPMQWEMLIRRCPTRSFTVVGDLDQRPAGSPDGGWKEILGRLAEQSHEEELTISYRTPGTVLEAASRTLMNAGFPVRTVRPARDIPGSFTAQESTPDTLEESAAAAVATWARYLDGEYGQGGGTIAVIAPEGLHDSLKDRLSSASELSEWTFDTSGHDVGARIHVIDAYQAKGLEFDVVVVLEPHEILAEGPGSLYVAMTRPTRQLHVIHTAPLPPGMETAE